MKEDEIESLGEIDILILPVGGNTVLSASQAAKVVNEIEPKIVIPSHYKMNDLIIDVDAVDKFIKEMGGKKEIDPMDRFRAIVLGITAYGSRFSKLFLSDLQKVRPDEVQKMIAFRAERLRSLGSLLREGQKAGVVRKGLDTNLSVEILLAAINGVMTPEFLAGGKYSFATAADGIFELFFRGVLEPGAVRVQKQRYGKVNNRAN
jgi:hypothetical protein